MTILSLPAKAATLLLSLDGTQFTTKTVGTARAPAWLLWSNGYVENAFTFPTSATYTFQVQAYGSIAANVWPTMEVRIDQKAIKTATISSTSAQTISFNAPVSAGSHKIEIAFTNDYMANGQDRNLFVQHLNVLSATSFAFTSAPAATNLANTSATINWSVSEPATGQVEYGTSTSYGKFSTPETSFNYKSHSQNLTGLVAGTTYHFRVMSKNASGAQLVSGDYTFKTTGTAPIASTPTPTPTPVPPASTPPPITATPTPPAQACALSSRSVTPAIGSQAAWDSKFDNQFGTTTPPTLSGNADTFAWQGHYWVRAYVSMAKTYGSTKYLDRAVKTIDYWFAHTEGAQGWGASINPSQMFLDTGVIGQAIMIFSHAVYSDSRFTAYRAKADSYVSRLEPIVHTYDAQWVNSAPYAGSPGFYVYATCNGICSPASLVMYNQGATMAKTLLLIDRVKRLQGQTPDPGYLAKANAAAAYFLTFARLKGSSYVWDYGGARAGTGIEDASHAHLDLSLVIPARKYGLGGLDDTDMLRLAATMHNVLNGAAGPSDVSLNVDGSGTPSSEFDRVVVGYDWIDLADYDATLYDQTVRVFNTYLSNPGSARFYLGWAEILRKRACVGL